MNVLWGLKHIKPKYWPKKIYEVVYSLQQGKKIDIEASLTFLFGAIQLGHTTLVYLLLESRETLANASRHGITPLHLACFLGNYDIVRALLEYGADVEVLNPNHESLLFMASKGGDVNIVQALLDAGAATTINIPQKYGFTPILIAAKRGNLAVVQCLLEYGAEIDDCPHIENNPVINNIQVKRHVISSSCGKYTPLSWAIQRSNNSQLIEFLILHGADVQGNPKVDHNPNLKITHGFRPLLRALVVGRWDMSILLVRHGADVASVKNYYKAPPNRTLYTLLLESTVSWATTTHTACIAPIRRAILCVLLVAKRQSWVLDDLIMHRIFEIIAFDWFNHLRHLDALKPDCSDNKEQKLV